MAVFSNYDDDKLAKAKRLLLDVYEYYYSAPGWARKVKRLETIIAKLESLENMEEKRCGK